jgi:hypothetical protein
MRISTLMLSAAALAAAPATAATNLVVNGDFEAGNSGFNSGYSYVGTPGDFAMYSEGTYTVGESARDYHNLWADFGAFEGDLFFIANGSTGNDLPAWQQTLTGLTVGASYTFSAYAVNVCCNADFGGPNANPFIVAVRTDGGTETIATSGAVTGTGQWLQFSGTFIATATTANLSIFNDNNQASGNDYGLDLISVTAVPEPATWAMMVGGFGVIGAAARRRARASVTFA